MVDYTRIPRTSEMPKWARWFVKCRGTRIYFSRKPPKGATLCPVLTYPCMPDPWGGRWEIGRGLDIQVDTLPMWRIVKRL